MSENETPPTAPTTFGLPKEVYDSFDDDFNLVEGSVLDVKSKKTNDDQPPETKKTKPDDPPTDQTQKEQPDDKDKPENKDGEKPDELDEETPNESNSDDDLEDDQPTYDDQIQELLKLYDTDEKKQQLLADLPNHDKFFANNTKKSQDVAKLEKEVTAQKEKVETLLNRLGSNEIRNALDKMQENEEDFDEFLNQSDDWYNGKESNPVRMLINAFDKSSQQAISHKTELDVLAQEKADLALEKEVVAVQGIDQRYKVNSPELAELAKIADAERVTLKVAHEIRVGREAQTKSKEFEDRIAKLENELKDRNKEIRKLKQAPGYTPSSPDGSGKGTTKKVYDAPPADREELRKRMDETWDRVY